ncbi:MAG: M48 family metallopeptidase [Chitinispirillia bacterium]|nr:M48 family metallopeptidase [Chitinispirillia bacterium]
MIFKTQAFYFDGQTSAPRHVELMLDSVTKDFSFTASEDVTVRSNIDNIKYETFDDRMVIKFKKEGITVTVRDKLFINDTKNIFDFKAGTYQHLINLNIKTFLLITPIVVALIAAVYISLTPIVAKAAVSLIPTTVDNRLGGLFIARFADSTKIDPEKTALLNEFAGQISWDNKTDLKFHVVWSGMVNALALPSGDIIIFTALLNRLEDYETLAALLAHEITHVNNRHSMQMICKSLIGYAFISVLTTDVSGLITIMMENANLLNDLSYSRNMEREADIGGLTLLAQNGINPAGMLKLMEVLKSSIPDEPADVEFISTHPGIEKRITHIESKIKANDYAPRPELERLFEKLQGRTFKQTVEELNDEPEN